MQIFTLGLVLTFIAYYINIASAHFFGLAHIKRSNKIAVHENKFESSFDLFITTSPKPLDQMREFKFSYQGIEFQSTNGTRGITLSAKELQILSSFIRRLNNITPNLPLDYSAGQKVSARVWKVL